MSSIRKAGMPTKEFMLRHMRLNEVTGCWEWTRYIMKPHRHGMMTINNKRQLVHRVAYQLWVGPIPLGMLVCHRCDNPPCFNPEHLFAGTQQDNVNDCISKGRFIRGETVGNHKLTASQVIEIRSHYDSGKATMKKLAEEFGVGKVTVFWIVHRKTWKHIP